MKNPWFLDRFDVVDACVLARTLLDCTTYMISDVLVLGNGFISEGIARLTPA